ncbi:glycosyl hydrolase [Conexibacter arvalis]|uniref:Alpha-L-rhamnosidase n=1 Tax=Conexibacter arvalis TaxID=912552 RepID=A0A840IIC0_9ACTN|nr:glycosyl hydrolase [Conexibacter arvalis]MBB4663784.1 hypothetical protein [Conexibacter arvalis]
MSDPRTPSVGELSRRRLLQLGAVAAGAGALASAEGAAAQGKGNGLGQGGRAGGGGNVPGIGRFAAPDRAVQPRFRWWWPHGMVDHAEIAREIDQIADAGFGGVEIADVHHSVKTPLDPAGTGWGTPTWVAAVEVALKQARKRGVIVDMTLGPSWPASTPTITPDSDAAVKEVAHGLQPLAAGTTYDGAVPEPVVAPHGAATRKQLLRVEAAQVMAGRETTRRPIGIVRDSLVDLTDTVRDGRIAFTAPAAGTQWVLISYWERGSGQQPEGGPHTEPESYVIDHFSAAGTQTMIDFCERTLLTREVRRLLRDVGGTIFEDSIEMETDATLWTPRMAQEFAAFKGYELMPVLAAVVEQDEKYVFDFDDATHGRIRTDYNDTLSQLYIDNHLLKLQRWARGFGMGLRMQPYGLETDAVTKAALLDVPEGESLGFKNLDDFRSLAGGRDAGGRLVLSNEAGGLAGGAYSTAWDVTLKRLMPQYAAGMNQAVFHGFAYRDVPNVRWPGFAAFSPYNGGPGYGEAWGPRQPTWGHVPDISAYLARVQHILQLGRHQVDVAFLRQKGYAGSGFGAAWFTSDGGPIGWTHNFLSPRTLHLPLMRVRGGRLAPDGANYKVLVFEGDAFAGREPALQLDTAERLLSFAQAGLPIVVVGDWSRPVTPGLARSGQLAQLKSLVDELLAQPTVRNVADRPNIPEGLASLGIPRDVEHAERSPLLHDHRVLPGADLYYLVNGHASTLVDHDVTFAPSGRGDVTPFLLDAWTGEIAPVAEWEEVGGRIRMRVRLKPGQTTIVALARRGWWQELLGSATHATATEADEIRFADRRLEIRSAQAGSYATTLAGGRTVRAAIGPVPAPIALESWSLEVEDWQPGRKPYETSRTRRKVPLSALAPWTAIPGLEEVSGIGRYTATITLGREWRGEIGAKLDLGEVFDTFRVRVNGKPLGPLDQVDTVVDLGDRLKPGRNTIEVEVATTLLNRLRVTDPTVFGGNRPQSYGLIGPVRLLPYGRATLPKR